MNPVIKILIAEHDNYDVEMIDTELKRADIDFISEIVQNETDYRESLKTFFPDIILCDYTFPSFDGPAAFLIREELAPNTPFILVSGTIGEENSIELIKNGVTDFVLKDKIFTLNIKLVRALKDAGDKKQKDKIDKELALSESHLAEAQKLAKMGSWDFDFKTDRLTWSKELYNVFGADSEKFRPTYVSYLTLIDENDRLLVQKTTTHTQLTGEPFTLEYNITTSQGEKRIIREHGYGKKDQTGKLIAVFGTAQDITAAKISEAALQKAYDEKHAVLESIDDGFFALDTNSVVTYWNKRAEILLDIKKEDLIGKNLHEVFTVRGSSVFYDNYVKAITEKITIQFEGFSKLSKKWFAVSAYGSNNGLSVYFKEITEQKNASEKLRESELRYRQIVETAQEGIWLIDENHKTTFVNHKMCEILEYTESEMLGKEIYLFMDEEGKQIAADLKEKNKSGHAWHGIKKYLSKTGKVVWANASVNPLYYGDGNYQGSLAMVTDITESRIAEKRNQFQATLLNTIGQAAIATDMQGKINFWNKAAVNIYGWTAEEVLGKNIVEITPAQQTKEESEQIMQELLLGNTWSGEFIVKRKNGEEFPAFVTNSPIRDQQQQLIGIIGVSSDITGRKQAELELKESNERYKLSEIQLNELNANLRVQAKELSISNADLEQFAYIASHDLQEPLRMITSFLTQLQKKYSMIIDDKGNQYIDFAVDGARRMRQIILDLLEFSRVGRTEDLQEDVDLNELINEVKILCRKKILEKKATIISNPLPHIIGFRSPLRQVFQNLVSNALKYTEKEQAPIINITYSELKDHWQFAVNDNGIGIDQEYFDKIFTIFQRLHNKEEFSGTGMGLAITKKIIETHGGSIWVESEVGKGSTFYFTLLKYRS